jgi:hypothetical protein
VASGGVRIQLLDTNHEIIAEGQQRFITEFDAEEGVEDLVALLTRIREQDAIRGRHIQRLPEVEDVGRNPLRGYQEGLAKIARQTDHDYLIRRNRFLDHLLARFGERFDDGILQRLDLRPFGQKDDFYHELIRWKIEFLRQYANHPEAADGMSLGAGKAQGFDYGVTDGPNETSGLERRLSLLLGLHGHVDNGKYCRHESQPAAGAGCFYLDKHVWPLEPEQVEDEDGVRCNVSRHSIADSWPTGEPNLNDLHNNFVFSSEDSAVLRQVLSYGTNRRNYRIHAAGNEHRVLLQTPHSAQSIEIHRAHGRAQAENAIDFLIADFRRIKENAAETYAGERLYVVEHVLLRPHRNNLKHRVHISDQRNPSIHLRSDLLEREQKDEYLELILEHGQHASNYSIQRDSSGNRLLVLHHNDRPIATSMRSFLSDIAAQEALLLLVELIRVASENPHARQECLHPPETDPFFSFRLSVLLPNWPLRFQSNEFKLFAEQMVQENCPAHLAAQCLWLSTHEMASFERMYAEWKSLTVSIHSQDKTHEPSSDKLATLDQATDRLKLFIEAIEERAQQKSMPWTQGSGPQPGGTQ